MILFQNYAGQWLPWMVSAFLFLCFIAPELSDDNSGGHPRVPFPSGNGGLYHRRPICHGRRYRPAASRAIAPRGTALDATKQSSPLPASHFQPTRHTPKLQVRASSFPPPTQCFFCFAYVLRIVVRYFSFKANPMSTVTTFVDETTGEEKERLINKGRWKGFGPTSVSFAEKGVGESFLFVCLLGCRTRSFSESLTLCMVLRRSRPSPLLTSKKCATSTINPLFRGWKR